MHDVDLLSEWLSFPGLTGGHIAKLAEAGVTAAAWIRAGHLATPRISTAGRTWTPDPFGTPAYVLPVYGGKPISEINPDPSVPLVDLLAFRLEEPERWWLRIGVPHLVLGKDQFVAAMQNVPIGTLCPSPLAWLQAGCDGICPLDLAEDFHEVERLGARAALAAEMATMKEGRPSNTAPNGGVSDTAAAKAMGVSRRSVQRAKKVMKEDPEAAA